MGCLASLLVQNTGPITRQDNELRHLNTKNDKNKQDDIYIDINSSSSIALKRSNTLPIALEIKCVDANANDSKSNCTLPVEDKIDKQSTTPNECINDHNSDAPATEDDKEVQLQMMMISEQTIVEKLSKFFTWYQITDAEQQSMVFQLLNIALHHKCGYTAQNLDDCAEKTLHNRNEIDHLITFELTQKIINFAPKDDKNYESYSVVCEKQTIVRLSAAPINPPFVNYTGRHAVQIPIHKIVSNAYGISFPLELANTVAYYLHGDPENGCRSVGLCYPCVVLNNECKDIYSSYLQHRNGDIKILINNEHVEKQQYIEDAFYLYYGGVIQKFNGSIGNYLKSNKFYDVNVTYKQPKMIKNPKVKYWIDEGSDSCQLAVRFTGFNNLNKNQFAVKDNTRIKSDKFCVSWNKKRRDIARGVVAIESNLIARDDNKYQIDFRKFREYILHGAHPVYKNRIKFEKETKLYCDKMSV